MSLLQKLEHVQTVDEAELVAVQPHCKAEPPGMKRLISSTDALPPINLLRSRPLYELTSLSGGSPSALGVSKDFASLSGMYPAL